MVATISKVVASLILGYYIPEESPHMAFSFSEISISTKKGGAETGEISSYQSTATIFGVANIHGSDFEFVMVQNFAQEKVETEQ